MELSRACGRLGETQYPDPLVQGYNPCAEQSLEPFESCCLATIFLPNVTSKDELLDIATLLYRFNKHSLQLSSHQPETDEVVKRNQRMGINITGVLQCSKEQLSWLNDCYEHLREFDVRYSKLHGFNPSIKLTTVQPSGTLSLLPGVMPGTHPGYAPYMYRRIRIAADSHVVSVCRQNGYPIEFVKNFDGSDDYGTVVVTFPFSYPEGGKFAKDMTAIDQLEVIKMLQTQWSDNSVSCTIYYKKEELPAIKSYLAKNYRKNHKTLSFLLHSDHGFKQAPFEEVSKEAYTNLLNSTTPITSIGAAEFETSDECAGGVCPVR